MHALELGGADEDSDIDLRSVRALAYGSLVLGISAQLGLMPITKPGIFSCAGDKRPSTMHTNTLCYLGIKCWLGIERCLAFGCFLTSSIALASDAALAVNAAPTQPALWPVSGLGQLISRDG